LFYIGIDASLTATGIVVLDDNCKIFASKIISSNKKETERLIDLTKIVKEFLINFQPPKMITTFIFLENYSFGSRAGQAFSIGEWGGVLRVLLTEMKFKVILVSPPTLKKFVTGKGNTKKEQMLLQVYKKYGQEFMSNDLCDAYGLARMNWSLDHGKGLVEYEKEALNKVKEFNSIV